MGALKGIWVTDDLGDFVGAQNPHKISIPVRIRRVCYLARARAMAHVVLAQIEFTRAIRGSRKISRCYSIIFAFHP